MSRKTILVLLLVIVALGAQSCDLLTAEIPQAGDTPAALGPDPASVGTQAPAADASPSPREAPAGPPKVGQLAPELTIKNLAGESVSLSDYLGRPVMLNFWATWCGYCQIEIPYMVAYYSEEDEQGLEILAVDLMEDREAVSEYVEAMGMEFPVLLDAKGQVGERYNVRGIPTSVFIDKEGIVRRIHQGTLTDALLKEYVAEISE